jgi:hypothetical protein
MEAILSVHLLKIHQWLARLRAELRGSKVLDRIECTRQHNDANWLLGVIALRDK